jgi:hypothetical protein
MRWAGLTLHFLDIGRPDAGRRPWLNGAVSTPGSGMASADRIRPKGVGRRRGTVAAAAILLGLLAWAAWPAKPPAPDWSREYDVSARAPELIPPGTVIGRTAPPGWSHLVIKGLPRVHPRHRAGLPDLTVRMASWLFTAFVADIQPDGAGHYRLRAVALGLGTAVDGRDTVVTPETAKQFGVDLTWITRPILAKGYEVQSRAVVAAHGPTLGLVDAPVWFQRDGTNALIRFRYALLVDGPTGRLDVLMWPLDPDRAGAADPPEAFRLDPGTIDEAQLIPDPAQFFAGIPTEAGFAVDRVPPYRDRLPLPPELRGLAAQTRFTPDEAFALETGLRQLTAAPPDR